MRAPGGNYHYYNTAHFLGIPYIAGPGADDVDAVAKALTGAMDETAERMHKERKKGRV